MSKRKQVKNACTHCQRACKKCDDARPCTRCVKYHLDDSCVDSSRKERKRSLRTHRMSDTSGLSPAAIAALRETSASPAHSFSADGSSVCTSSSASGDEDVEAVIGNMQHAALFRLVSRRRSMPHVPRPRGRPPKAVIDAAHAAFDALVRVCAESFVTELVYTERSAMALQVDRQSAQAPESRPGTPVFHDVSVAATPGLAGIPPRDIYTPPETPPAHASKFSVTLPSIGASIPRLVLPIPRLPGIVPSGGVHPAQEVPLHAPRPLAPMARGPSIF